MITLSLMNGEVKLFNVID